MVFEVEPYLRTLRKTNGMVPEFINPKYLNSERQRFKSPSRIESMMQDYPKLLGNLYIKLYLLFKKTKMLELVLLSLIASCVFQLLKTI